jgi:hypothetical protein
MIMRLPTTRDARFGPWPEELPEEAALWPHLCDFGLPLVGPLVPAPLWEEPAEAIDTPRFPQGSNP